MRTVSCVVLVLCLVSVCRAARLDVSVSVNKPGVQCVWGEWPEGLEQVSGWRFQGDMPHHLILYATTSQPTGDCPRMAKNPELVYVWGGEKTFTYGPDTVRKITPGTRYYVEVHNMHNKPLRVRLTSMEPLGEPKWQSFIGATALRSGRVWPGQTKMLQTPNCAIAGVVQRVRMHAHFATRVEMRLDDQRVLDTDTGSVVNKWYDVHSGHALVVPSNASSQTTDIQASCTYNQDSAVGFTWCNGCKREMCNGYAQFRLPIDSVVDQSICLGAPVSR
jgi:hypothetical protein